MSALNPTWLNSNLLQIRRERSTGVLLARYGPQRAVLAFKDGQMVNAQSSAGPRRLEGEAALYHLLEWPEGEVKWQAGQVEATPGVNPRQVEEFYETLQTLSSAGNSAEPPAVAEPGSGSVMAALQQMGFSRLQSAERFSLNSHFANSLIVAREVAADYWPPIAQAAGLGCYLQDDPPDNEERTTPIEYLSNLNSAFEQVFGPRAVDKISQWGRQATERSLNLRKSSGREQAIMKLVPGRNRKLAVLLSSYTRSMDHVRGEHLHDWKQIDENRFWLVHFSNLYALGRRSRQNACYIWTASLEAMLDWAGIWDDWQVEEIECGCVTGAYNCVFAFRPA